MLRLSPAFAWLLLVALGCAFGPPASDASLPDAALESEELVALRARAQQAERLERLVERLRRDLAEAEAALVAAESGLAESFTKAEVVSAVAEARIQVERAGEQAPWLPQLVQEARARLRVAEGQLASDHTGAAMYFATLAHRTARVALAEAYAAENEPGTLRVAAPRVNVREGPSTEDGIVATLPAGTPVHPESHRDDWIHIRTPDGRTGWIHAPLLH